MKIILIRHGKVDIERNNSLSFNKFAQWQNQYDKSQIILETQQKFSSIHEHLNQKYIITSNLKRSIQSAQHLFNTINFHSDLYRETNTALFNIPFLKLTPKNWSILYRIVWLFGYRKKYLESKKDFLSRMQAATDKLVSFSAEHKSIFLVGHFWVNHYIKKNLKTRGWKITLTHKPRENWGYLVFKKTNETTRHD